MQTMERTGWGLEPVELKGGRAVVRTSRPEEHEAIAAAIHDPGGWDARRWGRDRPAKIVEMLRAREALADAGQAHPFVYAVEGEIAGVSNYLRVDAADRSLEIGGTWVAPRWRRTFVNTEVKRLLLGHAFEALGAERVEFRVDASNHESQRAVLRLGATLEGRLRRRQIGPGGDVRDGFLFSVVRTDWPAVRPRLESMLAGVPRAERLPRRIETARLVLRPYAVAEAAAIFALVDRDRAGLLESHPKTCAALSAPERAEDFVIDQLRLRALGSTFNYGAFLREDGELAGQISVKNVDWEARAAELGYFLDARRRGQGLGREMAAAVLAELDRAGLARVFVRVVPHNEASLRLAKSVGFVEEGRHRAEYATPRGLSDIVYLSRVKARP